MKLCVGLVGEIGSGKGTFARFLVDILGESQCGYHRFSDILRETATLWSIPHTRENLQKMSIIMDGGLGDGTLSTAIKQRIVKDNRPVVVLDGIRWLSDENLVRELPSNIIVALTSSVESRFARICDRSENQGEEATTFEQFLKESKIKTEIHIQDIIKRADVVVENEGSIGDLKVQAKKFIEEYTNLNTSLT